MKKINIFFYVLKAAVTVFPLYRHLCLKSAVIHGIINFSWVEL